MTQTTNGYQAAPLNGGVWTPLATPFLADEEIDYAAWKTHVLRLAGSGSGLDPQISPAYARLQAPRVARARGVTVDVVLADLDGSAVYERPGPRHSDGLGRQRPRR